MLVFFFSDTDETLHFQIPLRRKSQKPTSATLARTPRTHKHFTWCLSRTGASSRLAVTIGSALNAHDAREQAAVEDSGSKPLTTLDLELLPRYMDSTTRRSGQLDDSPEGTKRPSIDFALVFCSSNFHFSRPTRDFARRHDLGPREHGVLDGQRLFPLHHAASEGLGASTHFSTTFSACFHL